MKFIPGTTFNNRTKTNTKLFTKNTLYILQDIKKEDKNTVTYTFLVDNKLKTVKFKSFKQAEDWLEQIKI